MKRKSIAKISVALAVIVLAALLALFGLKVPMISEIYGIKSLGGAMATGLDFGGGYAAEYTAEDASAEDLDAAVEILRARLSAMGYDDATAARSGENGIRIEFPSVTNANALAETLGAVGHMQIVDPSGNVVLEGDNIDSASVGHGQDGYAVVNLAMDEEGADAFATATASYVGQSISIYLDDALIVSPGVSEAITDGHVSVPIGGADSGLSQKGSTERASSLVAVLQSGELPVALELAETTPIGAKLGGALAGLRVAAIAVVALAIAALVWRYRRMGAAAGVSLSLYMLISLYAVAIIGVRMTVAGAAGLLVAFALAVHADVVLLESFRKELAFGRTERNAVRFGYKAAWPKLLKIDGAVFVVAAVAAYFCRGALEGFATMLTLGALTALISAVWFTRSQMYAFSDLGGGRAR